MNNKKSNESFKFYPITPNGGIKQRVITMKGALTSGSLLLGELPLICFLQPGFC